MPVVYTNACSTGDDKWIAWNPEEEEKWVRPMPPEGIRELDMYDPEREVMTIPEISAFLFPPEKWGRVGFVIGIRADESLTRIRAVSRRTEENYIVRLSTNNGWGGATQMNYMNVWKVYPIYDWNVKDVWLAPKKFGWDYNNAYDLMEMIGIPHSRQRIAPPYGSQPMKDLFMFSVCFPDVWGKMSQRVPGAATAARYAGTSLYVASSKLELPEKYNGDWLGYIKDILGDYSDKKMAQVVAHSIRQEISSHYRKTGNQPILPKTFHPDAGVSWDHLARRALRKDDKSRQTGSIRMVPKRDLQKFEAQLKKYQDEVNELKSV